MCLARFCARVRRRCGIIAARSVTRSGCRGWAISPVGAHKEGNRSALPGVVTYMLPRRGAPDHRAVRQLLILPSPESFDQMMLCGKGISGWMRASRRRESGGSCGRDPLRWRGGRSQESGTLDRGSARNRRGPSKGRPALRRRVPGMDQRRESCRAGKLSDQVRRDQHVGADDRAGVWIGAVNGRTGRRPRGSPPGSAPALRRRARRLPAAALQPFGSGRQRPHASARRCFTVRGSLSHTVPRQRI